MAREHTYTFSHDGKTYTRTTKRIYTHAVVCYRNSVVDYSTTTLERKRIRGGGYYMAKMYGLTPVEPYVDDVKFSSSLALAQKAQDSWHSHTVIIELEQPGK